MSLADAKAATTAHFACDEASGVLEDSIGTGTDLTDNNTVGTGAGKFGNARDYEADSTEYHGGGGSGPSIERGDRNFSGWAWVNMESSGNRTVMSCYGGSGWTMDYRSGSTVWRFYHDGNGAATTSVTVSDGSPTGAWKLIMWAHDATNNLLKLSIDGVAFTTQGTGDGSGTPNAGANLQVGAIFGGDLWDGLIDDCGVIHDYVWSDAEATELWNGGTGVAFDDWGGSGLVGARNVGIGLGTPGGAGNLHLGIGATLV